MVGAIKTVAKALALAVSAALALIGPPAVSAATIHFDGRTVEAPAGWPVYQLAQHPGMCVRLDRKAVYLGVPSPDQRCPAAVVGRRRAIVVDPSAAARRREAREARRSAPHTRVSPTTQFEGLGFDACTAPSSSTMSSWLRSSPYGAIGVYIGGLNRGCTQANLTSSWVSRQTAAGWQLIPTYVGRQSPTSSCTSCAFITPSRAAAQGSDAADDAVAAARGVGIAPGSPIYFDMESYTRTSSATKTTLTFLSAWTERLHTLGYTSGVYSSSASGIVDLAEAVDGPYELPDDLWFANWNGNRDSTDPYLPRGVWANHQRIHQFRGGHDETYGGLTINIDSNYVDGATAPAAPVVSKDDPVGSFDVVASPAPGALRVRGWAFDPNSPLAPLEVTAFVGGPADDPEATEYDLGPVATSPRPDVGTQYPKAGPNHGFDTQFDTAEAGRQDVCVYAIDVGKGEDRLLGCRTVTIKAPITVSNLRVARHLMHLTIACMRPAGTICTGQAILRARPRVRVPHGRNAPPTRVIRLLLAKRIFRLAGATSHNYRVPLATRARALLRKRRLRAQFVVASAGSRKVRSLAVGGPGR